MKGAGTQTLGGWFVLRRLPPRSPRLRQAKAMPIRPRSVREPAPKVKLIGCVCLF